MLRVLPGNKVGIKQSPHRMEHETAQEAATVDKAKRRLPWCLRALVPSCENKRAFFAFFFAFPNSIWERECLGNSISSVRDEMRDLSNSSGPKDSSKLPPWCLRAFVPSCENKSRSHHLPYLILLAAVLLVYSPGLRDGFVWDDTALVLRDPLIRSPFLLAEGFRHFLFLDATASDFYRPLQRAAFTLDYALAGFTPWVFHLTSLLVHAGAAMALYAFGWRLLAGNLGGDLSGNQEIRNGEEMVRGDAADGCACGISGDLRAFVPSCEKNHSSHKFVALLVALLWAVHPIHSSAVVYISGLADPLAALCGFGGLALLFARRPFSAGLCLGAALFAKESGALALVIGLAFAWGQARTGTADRRQRFARFGHTALPALVLAILYLGLRVTADHLPAPRREPIPFATRPVLCLRAVAEYAGLFVAPVTLRMEREVRLPSERGQLLGKAGDGEGGAALRFANFQTAVGALLFCGAAFWFWRAARTARACLLAAAAAYLPVSNLLALNATVAEHWIYLPSAFLLLAAAATLRQCPRPNPRALWLLAVVSGLWLIALGCRTAWRCEDWRDPNTFLAATIRDGGDSSRMLGNLALQKYSKGDFAGAVWDNREALQRQPDQPFAMLGLSAALIQLREFAEARQWLERCEQIPHVRANALIYRSELEFQESRRDRVPLLREAVAVNPHHWPVRKRLITHLVERGELAPALLELRAVLAEETFRAETWELLGQALERIGQPALARDAYAEADLRDLWRGKKAGQKP